MDSEFSPLPWEPCPQCLEKEDNGREIPAVDWSALIAHTVHPAKVAILEALHAIGMPLSATELTELLRDGGFSFDSIHYHLGALAKMAMAEEACTRPDRGSRERYYALSRSS